MKINVNVYIDKFNLQNAEIDSIDHDDAVIAEVFEVHLSPQKKCILKVCPHRPGDYFREVYFLQKLKNSLPVPRIIQTVKPSKEVHGAILMEYIEGHLLQRSDWSETLSYGIGKHLAHLHNSRTEQYGDPSQTGSYNNDAYSYLKLKFEETISECKNHISQMHLNKCMEYFSRHQRLLNNVDGPCLVHRDFRPGNMIVSEKQLKGIIDWAGGRLGFAEQDFASIVHFNWPQEPKYKAALLDGYSSARNIPNYQAIMPLLQMIRSLEILGFVYKSNTWQSANANLYKFNRHYLDNFDFDTD